MVTFIVICILLMVWAAIIGPFIKLLRVSRSWRKAAEEQTRARRRQQQRQQQPPRPKKKIDPGVGEYVEFTETTSTRSTTSADGTPRTTTETESQITDITWEDLP